MTGFAVRVWYLSLHLYRLKYSFWHTCHLHGPRARGRARSRSADPLDKIARFKRETVLIGDILFTLSGWRLARIVSECFPFSQTFDACNLLYTETRSTRAHGLHLETSPRRSTHSSMRVCSLHQAHASPTAFGTTKVLAMAASRFSSKLALGLGLGLGVRVRVGVRARVRVRVRG